MKLLIPCTLFLFATIVHASDELKPAEKPGAPVVKEESIAAVPPVLNQASSSISPDIIKNEPARKTDDGFIKSEFHGVFQIRYGVTNFSR